MLQQWAQVRGVALPRQVETSPQDLGPVLTDLHQTPGRLRDLLGGADPQGEAAGTSSMGSIFGHLLAKAALVGIAAMVVRRVMQGR